ncbi:VOC family protein [Acaryochloris sp. IP29b_bin.137]|uniref:VOC family protein n=1 Tax=Acaryochloris sp. IP29b_bin.137 TaxID=2969217 RepID=UPI0026346078|nr:VOC family protein [Acaryochloris sp. IP29b_bin.137]
MPGPAKAGLFIYAKDFNRLARFYESILMLSFIHQSDEFIILQSPDIQLNIHAMPQHIADSITISSPPVHREQSALKFFFTVPSISAARNVAAEWGGEVFTEQWSGPGFHVCNACDPEGNIFQVREDIPSTLT